MDPEYIFTRHGESVVNLTRTISNRVTDAAPLTERGRQQAEELLRKLQRENADRQVIAIYSSPLARARETAEILAAGIGIGVVTEDALREPDCGVIEGRGDLEAWQMHMAQTQAWRTGQHDYRIPGGESFNDVRDRFMPFIDRLIARHRADKGSVILVSHGSILMNMLPLLLANIDENFVHAHPLFNCASVVVRAAQSGLVCTDWCGERVEYGS